jgi:hypothetical protein
MEMDEFFQQSTKLTFNMDGEVLGPTLQVPSGWSRVKNDVYSVSFQLPITLLLEMAEANTIEVQADWANAMRDVDPTTEFGTVGLRNAIYALAKM